MALLRARMLHSRSHDLRRRWLAAIAAMMAVCVATLLPSLHAHVGCDDHRHDHTEHHACESGCTADHETDPTDSQAPHDHHDPSDCDLCKLIFTLDSSAMQPIIAELRVVTALPRGVIVLAAQVEQPAAPLDVRRSRGPPNA